MIYSDLANHKGLQMEGNINDVSAECVLIMGEIYKRNEDVYGKSVALGILTNMLIKAVDYNEEPETVKWNSRLEEKLAYTE